MHFTIFWENGFYGRADDGRTTDSHAMTLAVLCSNDKAELKLMYMHYTDALDCMILDLAVIQKKNKKKAIAAANH